MRAVTWTAYLLMACLGYLIYAIGFITPYVRHDLGVAAWVAALPNSAMAIGLVAGGAVASRINARIGPRRGIRTWSGLMAVACGLLAIPLGLLPILLGALAFGLAGGGVLVHVNSALGTEPRGGTLLTRANLWSEAGALAGPLVLSAAATTVGWRLGPLVPTLLLVGLAFLLPASPARDTSTEGSPRSGHLPQGYWRAWLFLILAIGAEFSFVAWGAQVVVARVGIGLVAATGLASLFVAGMVAGRLALSAGHRAAAHQLAVLRGGAALAVVGALSIWLAARPEIAGFGLLLGGLGISGMYPLGTSLAIAHAPRTPVLASARLTAASGVAIFSAPLGLGFAVSMVGAADAWLIVVGMLLLSLIVLLGMPVPSSTKSLIDQSSGAKRASGQRV